MPADSSANYALLGRLADEFAERYRRGERPALKEYIDRYPDLADEIREFFPAMAEIEQVKEDQGDAVANETPRGAPPFEKLGDYRIISEIGRGGMGVVYEAEQLSLGRHVALKVLPRNMLTDAKARRRFAREAKAAAKLHHTNIVPVFGVGEEDGLPYYVMQFIQGLGLDDVLTELKRLRGQGVPTASFTNRELKESRKDISPAQVAQSLLTGRFEPASDDDESPRDGNMTRDAVTLAARTEAPAVESSKPPAAPRLENARGPTLSDSFSPSSSSVVLPGQSRDGSKARNRKQTFWQSVATIGVQVAEALEYAHKQGIQHRDIKPSNLLLDTHGTVWVTDFGLAKAEGQQNLTYTGDILGTLRYMPPEAFQGKTDGRSDVYSLGMTLYELAALRPAFEENDRVRLVAQVTEKEPARLRKLNPQIPRDLETIVNKAIDKDPKRRYATAAEFGEDLQRFIADEPIRARRASVVERLSRWVRRNKGIAAALSAVAFLLLVLAIGSTIAAALFKGQESEQRALAAKNERLAQEKGQLADEKGRLADEKGQLADEKEQERLAAEKARNEAMAARKLAEERGRELQQNLYYAQMHLAQQSWREHRGLPHMRELLANWLPKGESPDLRGWEWFYVNSLPYQNLRTLADSGSSNGPCTVSWHVGSRRLAEGTAEGLIRIWDVDREQSIRIIQAPAPFVPWWGGRWLCWSPDGAKLVAGGAHGSVRIWETRSGRKLQDLRGQRSAILSVAFSSDGARVAAFELDGTIEIWDANTGQLTAKVAHPGNVSAGAWSPDDQFLACGHGNGTVTISGTQKDAKIVTLQAHPDTVYHLEWSPDSARIASTGSSDFFVSIWEVASKHLVLGPLRHSHGITAMAWAPDGQRLATGSMDNAVKIWDAKTGRETVTLRGHVTTVTSLAWGPDGSLASGGNDGSLRIWNSVQDQEARVLPGEMRATSVCWSPDGKQLASGSDDGNIRIWDAATHKTLTTLKGHDQSRISSQFGLIRSLAWSPDGTHLASAGLDGAAKVWELSTGREVFALTGHGAVWCLSWNPDGTQMAVGSQDGSICIVEGVKLTPKVRLIHAHAGTLRNQDRRTGVRSLAWSPQGDRLASTGWDSLVKLWDPIHGAELARMHGHQGWVMHVAWSNDGKRLATAGSDYLVIIWDAQTGQKLLTMRGHNDFVDAVGWSPDGERLASAGLDNSVRFWDPRTGEETFVLRGTSGMFHDIAWSPDGAQLAAASSDDQIWIWDARRGCERDRTARALPFIDRLVASRNVHGEDLRWCADSYVRAGRPGDALALAKDDPFSLCKVARQIAEQGHTTLANEARAQARLLLEKQLSVDPDNAASASELASLLLMDTTAGSVVPDRRRLTALRLTDPWAKLAAAYYLLGNQQRLESLLKQHPAAATAPGDLASVDGDWEQAIGEYSKAIANPKADSMLLVKRAQAYEATNRWNLAKADWARAVRDQPELIFTHWSHSVQIGVAAYQEGRNADAIRDLERARDVLRALHQAVPEDDRVGSQLGISLGFLGGALRDERRPEEALVSFQEQRTVLESMRSPASLDLYNLACDYAQLGVLLDHASTLPSSADREALAERAIATLRRSLAAGMKDFALIDRDHDLDPLRERPDFRALILESTGRTREAVSHLAKASTANPKDTRLSLEVAARQAWFGQDKELAATRQRIIAFAKGTNDAVTAERAARACSILPSASKAELESALSLGRTAVKLGPDGEWNLLAIGMAEYRSGNYAAAEGALLAAKAGSKNPILTGSSAYYLAMSLFRQGKAEEADKLTIGAAAQMKPLPKDDQNPLANNANWDDLLLWLAYKEAKAVIKPDAAPPSKAKKK